MRRIPSNTVSLGSEHGFVSALTRVLVTCTSVVNMPSQAQDRHMSATLEIIHTNIQWIKHFESLEDSWNSVTHTLVHWLPWRERCTKICFGVFSAGDMRISTSCFYFLTYAKRDDDMSAKRHIFNQRRVLWWKYARSHEVFVLFPTHGLSAPF